MATTSRGIVTPNQTDEYNLITDLNTMATSIDEALKDAANTYRGTSTQRTQFTSQAPEGTIWVDTNGEKKIWVKQGVSWAEVWVKRDPVAGSVSPSGGVTGSINWQVSGDVVQVSYDLTGEITSDRIVGTLPSSVPASQFLIPGSEYQYGAKGERPAYMNPGRVLRVASQVGVTRRRGAITYLRSV